MVIICLLPVTQLALGHGEEPFKVGIIKKKINDRPVLYTIHEQIFLSST